MIDDIRNGVPPFVYFLLIIPVLAISIGALTIWTEHRRKEKSLEVLKAYAERGQEPPEAVLIALNQAASDRRPDDGTSETGWRKFPFFLVMAMGFGGAALWTKSWGPEAWLLTIGFGITSFVMAALAASKLVQGLTGPKKHGR